MQNIAKIFESKIIWKINNGNDERYIYWVEYNSSYIFLILNNFPEEEMYSLSDGNEIISSFTKWPDSWTKP